jgi:Rieske 2Fe-2S family protein
MRTPATDVTSLRVDELEACQRDSGTMLPAAAYLGDDVLAWEQRHFFAAGWVCVGRADDLGTPGARRVVAVGTDSVLLVRGADGLLRGFYNVCRHRGHELLPCGAEGSGKFIRCPYHAWVYDTSGNLYGVPPTHEGDLSDPSQYSLVAARTREWNGFVFVNASGDAAALDDYLGGLDAVVTPYDMAGLRVGETHSYEIAANWKLIVENYDECFHCPSIHPELCQVSDPDSGTIVVGSGLWLGGTMWLREGVETMSLDGRSGGVLIENLPAGRERDIVYLHLFPNLLISLHPDYVMTHRMTPVAPGRTQVECQWLFPAAAWEREGFTPSYAADFWDVTNRQDWTACESVQRGVASPGYRPGPYSSAYEYVVKAFDQLVAQGYLSGELPRTTPVPEVVVDAGTGYTRGV